MSDEQQPEQQTDPLAATYDEQQLALEDALQKRRTRVQLEETARLAAEKVPDFGNMTDEQLRRWTRKIDNYDAI
jgi:hypothetical protein